MAYNEKQMLKDAYGHQIPQYYDPVEDVFKPLTNQISLTGNSVAEQKTQADAVTGTVTFSENIQFLEIYNTDGTNQGVFNVNGINITVPAGKSFKSEFKGTPRATVTNITGSTTYILTRYE
jgi:hypothetical protein